MVVKGLKGLQTFHNDYQRFEEKAFLCGKRAKRKRLIYELARNARSCVGAEGFKKFFPYSRDFDLCECYTPFKKPGI